MSRPKRVHVEGETVDIVWKAPLKRFRDGYPKAAEYIAETANTRAHIEIAPGQTHDDERRSLLHEILHDCAARGGARSQMKLRDEEYIITTIEPWLYLLLQQNPALVAWLMERRPEE